MTVEELKDYYKTGYRFEKSTKMTGNSFLNWMKWGYIPIESQFKIENYTDGQLRADIKHARSDSDR